MLDFDHKSGRKGGRLAVAPGDRSEAKPESTRRRGRGAVSAFDTFRLGGPQPGPDQLEPVAGPDFGAVDIMIAGHDPDVFGRASE